MQKGALKLFLAFSLGVLIVFSGTVSALSLGEIVRDAFCWKIFGCEKVSLSPMNNLVAWYKLDESAGATSFADSSGNGLTGVCTGTGCPTVTAGKNANAARFDGGDSVKVSSASAINIIGIITIATWAKFSSTSNNFAYLIGKGYDGSKEAYFLRFNGMILQAGSYGPNAKTISWQTSGINLTQWNHYAAVYDGSNWKLYVNGVLKATLSSAAGAISNNAPLTIGSFNQNGISSRYLNGLLDDAMIFNKALTQNEITELYNGGAGCVENWQCSDWGLCANGIQTRECKDLNNCGTTINRPPLTQTCVLTCTDFDGGLNYSLRSYIIDENSVKKIDYCNDTNILVEYYCNNNGFGTSSNYRCPNGCYDGACKSTSCAENWQCSEWSACTNGQQNRTCRDINNCGTIVRKPIEKQTCTSGNCTDSDGGENFTLKGTANDDFTSKTDYCLDSTTLIEYYCLSDKIVEKNYLCAQGNACFDGACISVSPLNIAVSVATLKDSYSINEEIDLTDPPDAELNSAESSEEMDFDLIDSNEERGTSLSNRSPFAPSTQMGRYNIVNGPESVISASANNFSGYIIKFEGEPLAVRKKALEDKAKANQDRIDSMSAVNPVKYILPLFAITPEEVEGKVEKYKSDIESQHASIKQKISGKLLNGGISAKAVENGENGLNLIGEYFNVFNGIALDVSEEEVEKVREMDGVEAVYPNLEVHADLMDSVPLINADDVWQLDANGNNCIESGGECLTGKGVKIAIIDTGVDYNHPDLGGCFGSGCKVIGGWDFVSNQAYPIDNNGHGTHVAATAAGNGVLKGVAPDAKILAYKVLNAYGSGDFSWVMAGIERAVDPNQDGNFDDHADIISMSLGANCYGSYDSFCGPNDPVSTSVDNAVSAGVVSVIAAGNSGPARRSILTPGTARKAITIGAVYKKDYYGKYWEDNDPRVDQVTSFSSRGPVVGYDFGLVKPDVVAPGAIICAAEWDSAWSDKRCLDDKHVAISGTSMATPHVAGVVALLLQKDPSYTADELKSVLRSKSKYLGDEINVFGYGRVDVLSAVRSSKVPIAKVYTGGLVKNDDKLNILGSANGERFSNYKLYYGVGVNNYRTGAIDSWVLITSSNNPVLDGVLYSNFDSSVLAEGMNVLRLVVESTDGTITEDRSILFVLGKQKNGWPVRVDMESLGWSSSMPANLDDDLEKESVVIVPEVYENFGKSYLGGAAYAFNPDGTSVEGWPRHFGAESSLMIGDTVPAIADLNKDSRDEIIIKDAGGGNLAVLNSDSSNFGCWPKDLHIGLIYSPLYESSPVVADLDNDGENELVISRLFYDFGVNDYRTGLHVFEKDCSEWKTKEWPKIFNYNGAAGPWITTPVVADLDNDGKKEIVLGVYNKMYVLYSNGSVMSKWPKQVGNSPQAEGFFQSGPVVGNLDNNPDLEIVAASHSGYVYVWYYNGTSKRGWPKLTEGVFYNSPALGDINLDGKLDIVAGSYWSNYYVEFGIMYVWNANGSVNGATRFNVPLSWYSSPVIANVNEDPYPEIIMSAIDNERVQPAIYAINHLGEYVNGWPKDVLNFVYSTPLIEDFDNDGKNEMEVLDADGNIYLFELDAPSVNSNWPMFKHDPQHTGCYNCTKDISPPKPSRPQSKIVNNENASVTGNLFMAVQKFENGVWNNENKVVYKTIIINPGQTYKLDAEWNPQNVSLGSAGKYRVHVEFNYGLIVSSDWEFSVVGFL